MSLVDGLSGYQPWRSRLRHTGCRRLTCQVLKIGAMMIDRDGAAADCIMGVDPGVSGAVAFLFPDDMHVIVMDLPVADGQVDAVTLAGIIGPICPAMAIVEKVHSMPKQGVAS